jgi:hypothetical protein
MVSTCRKRVASAKAEGRSADRMEREADLFLCGSLQCIDGVTMASFTETDCNSTLSLPACACVTSSKSSIMALSWPTFLRMICR